jgi:hypothetical protein
MIIALAVAAGMSVPAASAFANHPTVSPSLGTPIHGTAADRTIAIGPATTTVNVGRNETIEFVVTRPDGGQARFAWRFDTLNVSAIDLQAVAPAGLLTNRAVWAYVGRDPNESAN